MNKTISDSVKLLSLEKELARRNLVDFMKYKQKYYHLKPFYENWHQHYIAEHLNAVKNNEISRLIVNMPPSYGKTEEVARSFISHTLGTNPLSKFIYTSYNVDLTESVSTETRDWMKSPIYQGIFDTKISKSAETKTDWKTTAGGGLYATTVGGGITGRHGHYIIIDDPMKASDAYSKAARDAVYTYFKESLLSRLEEFGNSLAAIIIIMQRLHVDDLVGRLIAELGGLWTHINLPALLSAQKTYCFGGFTYTREAGEPLFLQKHSHEQLEQKKIEMGTIAYETQMQQNPLITKAGVFKEEWFIERGSAELPVMNEYIMVDSAESTQDTADDRGIVVPGWWQGEDRVDRVCLLDCWRGKWLFSDFLDYIVEAAILHPDADIWIEGAGGGIIVAQELPKRIAAVNSKRRRDGKPLIKNRIQSKPPSNKISKEQKILDNILPYLQNGQVYTRRGGNGISTFIAQAEMFTPEKRKNDDNLIDPFANSWDVYYPATSKEGKKLDDLRRSKNQNRGWNI